MEQFKHDLTLTEFTRNLGEIQEKSGGRTNLTGIESKLKIRKKSISIYPNK